MLGRLDRYVIGNIGGSYAATLVLVMFLWVIMDLLLNMTRFVNVAEERGIGLLQLLFEWARYHLVSLPALFVMVAPFVTVIASMFAISRLMAGNEIVPMLFTGRSAARILRPALASGLLSAAVMAGIWELMLPTLSRPMEQMASLLQDRESVATPVLLRSRDGRQLLMCDRYDHDAQRMEDVALLDRGSGVQDWVLIQASAATWSPEPGSWELVDGVRQAGDLRSPQRLLEMEGVTPEMLWLAGREAKTATLLSYSELWALMRLSPARHDLVIAFHYHLTWPLANLVLLLLALPFAIYFERGSRVGRMVFAIAVCAAYFLVDLIAQNLGRAELLHPVVAAWSPIILFGSLGLVMFSSMRT